MKTLIILAALFTLPAFAGEKPFMEIGDIKGESETVTNTGEETAGTVKASSIDYGEKHRPETSTAKTAEPEDDWESPVRQQSVDSNSIRNMKRQDRKEVVDGKTNRKASGYNSSRSNRRGDEKYSKDGQPKCNAKDTDCDDAEDK
ncbi:MAG: hypothetical protein GWP02_04285 [Desulfobulbaceae bacterium]|nr:hypothetical protein [Desulfobulbaceae bacterium]